MDKTVMGMTFYLEVSRTKKGSLSLGIILGGINAAHPFYSDIHCRLISPPDNAAQITYLLAVTHQIYLFLLLIRR